MEESVFKKPTEHGSPVEMRGMGNQNGIIQSCFYFIVSFGAGWVNSSVLFECCLEWEVVYDGSWVVLSS